MSKTVALPIETKVRELDGKIWLALNLIQSGHRVAIGRKGDIKYSLDIIQPDIYFELAPSYFPSAESRLKKLKHEGTKIFVLDTEGGVFPSDEFYYKKRLENNILKYAKYYLAWGEATQKIIQRYTDFPSDLSRVTGNPRFDLLHPDLRQIYEKDAKSIQKKYDDYILINTKFGISNNKRGDIEQMLEKRKRDLDRNRLEHNKKLLQKFLSLIPDLATHLNENIVIRPHPSEDFTTYRERFDNLDNVFVRHKGDVRAWIYASQAVIHNSCTTGIESAMLEVPVFTYRPIKDNQYDSYLPNFVSNEVQKESELIAIIQNVSLEDQHNLSDEQHRELKRYFYNLDTRAANEIRSIVDNTRVSESKDFSQFRTFQKTAERTFKRLPGASHLENHLGIEGTQKFPGLSQSELRERISLFIKFVNCDSIVIEKIGPWKDAYWIYSRK